MTICEPNPRYKPIGAAAELWRSKAPEILIEGPAGTGKTRALLEKIVALSAKYSGSRHLICRATRAAMTQSVLVTLEEKVFPSDSPLRLGPKRELRNSYKFPNGSEIVVGGLDHPERTFSTEYDTITVFEAVETTENQWEMLHRALRNGKMPYQQAMADCNPGPPNHWLNVRANAGKMQRLLSRHEDNPQFFDQQKGAWTEQGVQYISRLDSLSGHRKLRLRFGKWAAAEGIVYEDFDAAINLIDPFPIPPSWRRIRSIDFGFTNPFVCQWWAFDNDSRMYLYREIYKSKKLVEDHAADIIRLSHGENIEKTVADWDAEDRATLERHGVLTYGAFKEITPGIQTVSTRLKKAGDGRARLFVFKNALVERDQNLEDAKLPCCTAEEFDVYMWPKGQDGKSLKEIPLDKDNHGMDSMRYAVAEDIGETAEFDTVNVSMFYPKQ